MANAVTGFAAEAHLPGTGAISFGSHRYKAALDRVAPAARQPLIEAGDACLLGVSLGSLNFEGARLEASIEWISANFRHCGIVVGDTVYRKTLTLLHGLSETDARAMALTAGRTFAARYAPLFRQYAERCTFTFIFFSAVEQEPSFPVHLRRLEDLTRADAGFAASVDAFADLYLGRGDKLDNPLAADADRARAIAISYLIEESALFAVLSEQGWPLIVYPGSIASIEGLCEGRFAGAPAPLTKLAVASLTLRKRGLFFADGAEKVVRRSGDSTVTLAANAGEFMADLDDTGWNALLKAMKLQKYAPREAMIKAGEADRRLCLLVDGRAEVSAALANGARQQIAILEGGTVLGEQSFLDGLPRSADVTALTNCEIRTLSAKDFRALRANEPTLALDLIADLGRIVSLRSRRLLSEVRNLP